MAQNIDILPKCPICGVSFYCIGIQTIKLLKCGHMFCQLCVNKLRSNSNYLCCFDNEPSQSQNWGELASYFQQYLDRCQNTQELKNAIEQNFNYNRSVLPCSSRKGCVGSCGNIHSAYNWKEKICPFGNQCPNANQCIFRHPNEAETLPMLRYPPVSPINQMMHPQVMAHPTLPVDLYQSYSETTAPKPAKMQDFGQFSMISWQCRNCFKANSNCAACSYCGALQQ